MGLVKSRIQIIWSGSTTVSAKGWTITIYSTGWGGWDSLWQKSGTNFIKPNGSYNVAFWDSIQIITWDSCSTNPTIKFQGTLTFSPIVHGSACASKPIQIGDWKIAINWALSDTYANYIGWSTYFNSTTTYDGSATFNAWATFTWTIVNIKWTRFQNSKVWINKNPTNNSTLQVNGWINIRNDQTSFTSNDFCTSWTIEYFEGTFYGCVNNTWKKFQMQNLPLQ